MARELPFLGVKGTTGTQASFLALFGGDHAKVKDLERRVTAAMGFERAVAVSGQTYTRKLDWWIAQALVGIAASTSKFAVDLRLLQHRREVEEPFETQQIGSSAMPYKRNPMRSERVNSLARLVLSLADSPAQTAANQWLERTLDDSANRRISLPEAFLATEACLLLVCDISNGLVVNRRVIERALAEELPFMASEEVLMAAVKKGGDRQKLHERLRQLSMEVMRRVKEGASETISSSGSRPIPRSRACARSCRRSPTRARSSGAPRAGRGVPRRGGRADPRAGAKPTIRGAADRSLTIRQAHRQRSRGKPAPRPQLAPALDAGRERRRARKRCDGAALPRDRDRARGFHGARRKLGIAPREGADGGRGDSRRARRRPRVGIAPRAPRGEGSRRLRRRDRMSTNRRPRRRGRDSWDRGAAAPRRGGDLARRFSGELLEEIRALVAGSARPGSSGSAEPSTPSAARTPTYRLVCCTR